MSAVLVSKQPARAAARRTGRARNSAGSAATGSPDLPRPARRPLPNLRRLTATRRSTSPRRSSPRRPPSRASASRSRSSSPTSRARWSCSPTAIPRRRASSSTPSSSAMMEAVHRYEGTVNQVMGDGIMALFGAPLAHEDHAVRACYAALRMQDAVRQLRGRAAPRAGRARCRSASASTPARSWCARSAATCTWTTPPSGQTTHLAARMEQLAAPGTILLTAETLRAGRGLRPGHAARPGAGQGARRAGRGVRAGRGRRRPHPARRPRRARGLTRFVGRDAELEQLRGALDRAEPGARPGGRRGRRAGRGQVAALLGVHPLPPRARLAGRWRAGSVSYGKATAYLPVIELLRGYFEIESRDDPRKIREKVTGKLLTLDPALGARRCPPCWRSSTCRWTMPSWQALDPLQRRQRTLDAVKRLLLRESQVQPLLRGLRGPALDRRRDPGAARQPRREPARGAPPAARQLPPRVPARLGRQDLLPPAPARSAAARERRRAARGAPRRRRGARPAQAAPDRADGGESRSSSRRACGRWSRPGRWPASAAPTGSPGPSSS